MAGLSGPAGMFIILRFQAAQGQTDIMEAERINQISAHLQDLAQRSLELRGYL